MKRTYHTNLLIKYKLGALDIDTINKIIAQKALLKGVSLNKLINETLRKGLSTG